MKQVKDRRWSERSMEFLSGKIKQRSDSIARRMLIETEDGQDPYDLDFSGREALAERLGKELASTLLEENVLQDLWREIVDEAVSWNCPRCGGDSPRHKDEDGNDAYEEVVFKTKVGDVPVKLRLFRCSKCRKSFSPLPSQG